VGEQDQSMSSTTDLSSTGDSRCAALFTDAERSGLD
jgi:hypothetical protein